MPLTDMEVKKAAPQAKNYWLSDERGLRLKIAPNGGKYWRFKYRFAGKQKTLALGVYPDVGLKDARLARDRARMQLAEGVDPGEIKQQEKRRALMKDGNQFSGLAKEWWENQKGTWTEDHAKRVWGRLQDNTFKQLNKKPIDQITPQEVLAVIRQVEARGALDVAGRVLQDVRRVFSFGVQTGKLVFNPASDLSGVLKTRKTQHRDSLPISELGHFMSDLGRYHLQGRLLTQLALELLVVTFVRPGELRATQWSEIDLKKKLWRIPAERMKMNAEHLVPLSQQAVALFKQVKPITEDYDLVFPSERKRDEPMSDNTMRRAMFRLGYDGKTEGKSRATPHGFRANAASVLNEKGFNPDAIERQLSHVERNKVRAAYTHHAQYLKERTEMMQWWADHLDELKAASLSEAS